MDVNGEVWVSLMLTKMNSQDGFLWDAKIVFMVTQKHEIDFKMNSQIPQFHVS